ETEDGFRIAEEDLKLRGEGDVLGTRQSGMPGFRVARIETHGKLIGAARDDAALMLARDPTLASARGQALRHLLYLFAREEAIGPSRADAHLGFWQGLPLMGLPQAAAAVRFVCVARASRESSASAASFLCWSPASTIPADISSVIAASTVMSRSMMSRRAT